MRDAFAAVVAEQDGQAGAQLTAYAHGRQVVDLWAGDEVSGDTLTGVYSSTKAPRRWWRRCWSRRGSSIPTSRWPGTGRSSPPPARARSPYGTCSPTAPASSASTAGCRRPNDALIARRLAGQRPYWRPGAAYGYGGFVSFAMVNEVIRRVTGQSLQQVYDERIRIPYGLDLYLGLPEAEEGRFRPIQWWVATREQEAAFWSHLPGPHSILGVGYGLNSTPPLDQVAFANTREVRANGQASAGGVGSARGLAGLYAAALWGRNGQPPLLKPETVGEFSMLHSTGADLVRGDQGNYALGFQAKGLRYPFLSANAFGHDGSAGSESFADPVKGVTPRESGIASGLVNTSQQIGGALGLAVLAGVAVTATTRQPAGTSPHDALTSGYTAGMLGAGGFYLAAILTAVFLLRPRPANRDPEPTPESLGGTPG